MWDASRLDKAGTMPKLPLLLSWGQEVCCCVLACFCLSVCLGASLPVFCLCLLFWTSTLHKSAGINFKLHSSLYIAEQNYILQYITWQVIQKNALEALARREESWLKCFSESPQLLADSEWYPELFRRFPCMMTVCVWHLKDQQHVPQIPLSIQSSLRSQTHSPIAYLHLERIKWPASLSSATKLLLTAWNLTFSLLTYSDT